MPPAFSERMLPWTGRAGCLPCPALPCLAGCQWVVWCSLVSTQYSIFFPPKKLNKVTSDHETMTREGERVYVHMCVRACVCERESAKRKASSSKAQGMDARSATQVSYAAKCKSRREGGIPGAGGATPSPSHGSIVV